MVSHLWADSPAGEQAFRASLWNLDIPVQRIMLNLSRKPEATPVATARWRYDVPRTAAEIHCQVGSS